MLCKVYCKTSTKQAMLTALLSYPEQLQQNHYEKIQQNAM
jgi:Fe-S cluster biosynthesis and repair protein YggX